MQSKIKLLPLVIYLYIALPFIIFASGFLKWYFAIPSFVIVFISAVLAASYSEGLDEISFSKKDIPKTAFGVLLIVAIVLLSGIGNVFWQNSDHAIRNSIFNILVEESWPPVFSNGNALVYYIGFWLPSALVGKVFSLQAGYIFQIIWAVLGLCLIWLCLCALHKKVSLIPLVIFFFFSGLDSVGHFIAVNFFDPSKMQIGAWASAGGLKFTYHLEWWARTFQFSSHMSQLFWVFNQAIPAWLALLVLIGEKSNKNLVFVMGLTLLSSPFPFVGLIPIFLWCAFTERESLFARPLTKNPKKSFLSLFSFQNVVGGGISGIISFIYLVGNIASVSSSANSGSAASSAASSGSKALLSPEFFALVVLSVLICLVISKTVQNKAVLVPIFLPMLLISYLFSKLSLVRSEYYVLFIILEVLVFAVFVYPVYGRTSVFAITIFSLLIIPFFKVGKSIDFCMRASIPALLMLCLLVMFSLKEYISKRRLIPAVLLIVVLFVGAVTPIHEISRTVAASFIQYEKQGEIKNKVTDEQKVMKSGNFTGKTEGSIFFEYLAR
jgi:uncharacterized membrane protein YidH (DUF202 family)